MYSFLFRNMEMAAFLVILSLSTYAGLVYSIPSPQCSANFRWDDCGKTPTPVIYYWKPGSRCEVGIWRGCLPNLNMFKDEYECVSTCIFTVRAADANFHQINAEDEIEGAISEYDGFSTPESDSAVTADEADNPEKKDDDNESPTTNGSEEASSANPDPASDESEIASSANPDPASDESEVASSANPDPASDESKVASSANPDPASDESATPPSGTATPETETAPGNTTQSQGNGTAPGNTIQSQGNGTAPGNTTFDPN